MNDFCPYLKPDPNDTDCYICGKPYGPCVRIPNQCPAFLRLLRQIFGDEETDDFQEEEVRSHFDPLKNFKNYEGI